jgi:hypothetical protein
MMMSSSLIPALIFSLGCLDLVLMRIHGASAVTFFFFAFISRIRNGVFS